MDEIRDRVAYNLRRIRNAQQMSQEQLALNAAIDRSYVSLLESGKYSASVTMLNKLAVALGVDIVDFFERPPPKTKSR